MKKSNTMKKIIEQLAAKHEIDLAVQGAHFRLDMPHFDRLNVEVIGLNRISVAHYFEQNGDLVADPEIVFWVCPEDGNWYAIGVTQVFGGSRTYAWIAEDGTSVTRYSHAAQTDLASFANLWARNIVAQRWLQDAMKHVWSADAEGAVNAEEGEIVSFEEPGYETLLEWFDRGVGQALDGCEVATDEVCPHGFVSWVVHVGMI